MQWFSAIIPAYPEIQAKAHAELDRVVGRDRLPMIEDEQDLPYVRAIIKVSLKYLFKCSHSTHSLLGYRKSSVPTILSGLVHHI